MRFLYLTVEPADDRTTWSGTNFYLMEALKACGEVIAITAPQPRILLWCRIFNQISLRLFGKRFDFRHSRILARAYARNLNPIINAIEADYIIAPAGIATTAYLKTTIPIVYINDRCIEGALNYHSVLSNLWSWSRKQSIETESRAIRNAELTVYSSEWAAEAARRMVPDAANRIAVIPFGANMPFLAAPSFPSMTPQKLLFVGVDWKNKGGDIVIEAFKELAVEFPQLELVCCGALPSHHIQHDRITFEGFLNKNHPSQAQQLLRHFQSAGIFVLPTRFEAYGIVFCEAAANALPVIATDTGGISTIVRTGETGFLLPPTATSNDYANAIRKVLTHSEMADQMRKAARKRYEEVLNWPAFCVTLLSRLQ